MGEACHLPLWQMGQTLKVSVTVPGGRPLVLAAARKGLGLLLAQQSSFLLLPPKFHHPPLDWVGLQFMSPVYILSPGPPEPHLKPPGGDKQEEGNEAGTTQPYTQQLHGLAIEPSKLLIKTTKTGALRARAI